MHSSFPPPLDLTHRSSPVPSTPDSPLPPPFFLSTGFEDSAGGLYLEAAAVRRSCSTGTPLLQPAHSTRPCVRRASFLQRQGSGPAAFGGPAAFSQNSPSLLATTPSSGGGFANRFAQAFQLPDDAMNSRRQPQQACCNGHNGQNGQNGRSNRRRAINNHPPLAVGSPLLPAYAKSTDSPTLRNPEAHPLLSDFELSSSSTAHCCLDHSSSSQPSLSPLDRTGTTHASTMSFGESSDPSTPAGGPMGLPAPMPLERTLSQG